MSKIVNITDKLSMEKPKLVIGEREYLVNDSMATVLKFQELASESSVENLTAAIEVALGKTAANELDIQNMSVANFQVIATAILAAMQDMEYGEAEARFQAKIQS